jgi:hypothetical protein
MWEGDGVVIIEKINNGREETRYSSYNQLRNP